MNAVEIEEAVSQLASEPFDPETFPFAFLEAFGNKKTTIQRLKSQKNSSNQSDMGGVLQRNNIHIKVCDRGGDRGNLSATLTALRDSPATKKYKAKFILATDGESLEAENLADGETIACEYEKFADRFGFFLPLAGITTVRQIRENAFDIKATSRLNRLYLELLKENPGWDGDDRREDLNHFMARLIFCFFAEDTNIFHSDGLFTATIAQMSEPDSSNTHEVLSELFRAMRTPPEERAAAGIANWADRFPYANGGLFSGSVEVPRFSKVARSYLLHVGGLDWTKINPDIFGSMIQAVADEGDRAALGMHYTSVPNILKVLNPLFLDELREQLAVAGESKRKLLNLRDRLSKIRVFDPACGSGNFLVIAYKEMRAIEAEINKRRGEESRESGIPISNFRGIEIRHFSCEVARLALVIAEYQCNVLYLGQRLADLLFLPLKRENWITCGNALRLDWLSLCPPGGEGVKLVGDDLFSTPLDQTEMDFENLGGEVYICGNPPYLGSTWQSKDQKSDLKEVFEGRTKKWKSLDYVAGWFMKAADYGKQANSAAAFVSTNSICQGEQVPVLWPIIFSTGTKITFAHTSFKWSNLASYNAGVTVTIIGLSLCYQPQRIIFSENEHAKTIAKSGSNINAYLVHGTDVIIEKVNRSPQDRASMVWGNKPTDNGNFFFNKSQLDSLLDQSKDAGQYIRPYFGAAEFIRGLLRYSLWIEDSEAKLACRIPEIAKRIDAVRQFRASSKAAETRPSANFSHRFR